MFLKSRFSTRVNPDRNLILLISRYDHDFGTASARRPSMVQKQMPARNRQHAFGPFCGQCAHPVAQSRRYDNTCAFSTVSLKAKGIRPVSRSSARGPRSSVGSTSWNRVLRTTPAHIRSPGILRNTAADRVVHECGFVLRFVVSNKMIPHRR